MLVPWKFPADMVYLVLHLKTGKNKLRQKNLKVSLHAKGVNLQSGSGRILSYPRNVEELVEWILMRRDCHLPVGTNLIQSKAIAVIKLHNPAFKGSKISLCFVMAFLLGLKPQ